MNVGKALIDIVQHLEVFQPAVEDTYFTLVSKSSWTSLSLRVDGIKKV